MLENWNKFINEILTNTDNDQTRSVEPIDNNDKTSIVQLDETEALMLWNTYFSETVKFALQYERTYEEPIMTEIFDEREIDANTLSKILRTMHSDETPILIYWSMNTAVKTTWGMFIKYWGNFFYSAGDEAIIYVNQNDVYIYTDMIVRKINKLKNVSEVSAFDYLQKLGDEKAKKICAFENLFNGIPSDLHNDLYYLFHELSEGIRVMENEEFHKEYIGCNHSLISSLVQKITLICKPYSEESLQGYLKDFKVHYDKSCIEQFNKLLDRIIADKVKK